MHRCRFAIAWRLVAVCALLGSLALAQERVCWLRDGSSPSPSMVYLLCEQGMVVVTADGGATWQNRATAATGHLRSIAFLDANHGYAVGDGGLILATEDGGKKWAVRKTGVKDNLAALQFVGQSGWAVGFDGVILHTSDGGVTWAAQETGTKESLEGVFFLDAERGWAVGWAGTIMRTTNGGKTWQMVKAEAAQWSLTSVFFRDANNGWAVGFSGQILRSTDGGATWKSQPSPVQAWLSSIAFDKSNRGWITADDNLLVSDNGGGSWRVVAVENRLFLSQMVPVNGALWAVGQLGVLKQTADVLKWKKIDSLITDDPSRDMATSGDAPAAGH
ncbi:MAG TPA: YCF48-related protein [Bryobacteraceae bacterium]|nr:YCF48-related protein [Bryobacteraceae bacterium]